MSFFSTVRLFWRPRPLLVSVSVAAGLSALAGSVSSSDVRYSRWFRKLDGLGLIKNSVNATT